MKSQGQLTKEKWDDYVINLTALDRMNEVIYMSPYWHLYCVKKGSHDDMYNESGIRILLADIIKNPEETAEIVRKKAVDAICGFESSVFSQDPKEFLLEFLTPDWCSRENVEMTEGADDEFLNMVNSWRRHNFNAPKVCCAVYYMRYHAYEDFSNEEFMGLSGADCFREDITLSWGYGKAVYDLVYQMYLDARLRRCD